MYNHSVQVHSVFLTQYIIQSSTYHNMQRHRLHISLSCGKYLFFYCDKYAIFIESFSLSGISRFTLHRYSLGMSLLSQEGNLEGKHSR